MEGARQNWHPFFVDLQFYGQTPTSYELWRPKCVFQILFTLRDYALVGELIHGLLDLTGRHLCSLYRSCHSFRQYIPKIASILHSESTFTGKSSLRCRKNWFKIDSRSNLENSNYSQFCQHLNNYCWFVFLPDISCVFISFYR